MEGGVSMKNGSTTVDESQSRMSSSNNEATADKGFLQRFHDVIKDNTPAEAVSLRGLFRYATLFDIFCMSLATIAALGNGIAPPLLTLIFGNLINTFTYRAAHMCSLNFTALSNNNCPSGVISSLQTCNFTEFPLVNADFYLVNETRKQAFYLVAIGFSTLVLTYLQVVLWSIPAQRQTRSIREFLLRSIINKEAAYFDTHEIGELNTYLIDVVDKIHDGIGDKLGFATQFMTSFITGFALGFAKGWKLTLVIMSVSSLIFISTTFLSKLVVRYTAKEIKACGRAGAVAEEVFGSIRTVLCYNGQEREQKRYERFLNDVKMRGIEKGVINGLMLGIMWFVVYCSYALAFWYGAKLIREENYNIGNVFTTFLAIIVAIFNLGQAGPYFQIVNQAKAAAHIVWRIIDAPSKIINDSEAGLKKEHLIGDISFSNIHFSYPSRPGVSVLTGLSFNIQQGQTTALVGSSGSGKSTCVHLLQRFYDPDSGILFIDGHRADEYNLRWLRQQIGIVNQEPILFQATIRENILLGCESATDEDVEKAATMANAHDFIMDLPEKYETQVGQQGATLSGGQKQRIAIARALIRNPRILLLDEATSALDNDSEKAVQDALYHASKGRTTLVIAHRLSTIRDADKIIVINEGQIIEEGNHESLMLIRGTYYDLVEAQKLHVADEEFLRPAIPTTVLINQAVNEREPDNLPMVNHSLTMSSSIDDGVKEKKLCATLAMLLMNKPEWLWIIIGCLACLCNGAIVPALGLVLSKLIAIFEECDQSEQERRVRLYVLLFTSFGVLYFIAMLLQNFLFAYSGESLTARIRAKAFRSILRQEMAFFDDPKNNTGTLCARLAGEASAVQALTAVRLGGLCQNLAALGMSIIIGFIFSWQLTLLILVFMPFVVIGSFLQSRLTMGCSNQGQKALEDSGKIAMEMIENIRTVIQLTKEDHFVTRYSQLLSIIYWSSLKRAHIFGFFLSLTNSASYFVMAAIFSVGSHLVNKGLASFEDVLLVFTCIVFSSESVGQTASLAPDYGKAANAAEKFSELFARNPAIDNGSNHGDEIPNFSGQLEFNHVHFIYPTRPEAIILKSLQLKIQSGSHVALVGTSGAGKSTCVQLIERLYDVSVGCLLADSKDIRSLNLQWYRSQIGFVPQEPVLFDMSIRDNIAYGDNSRNSVPLEEIIRAAQDANIHNFIQAMPDGYQTNCGPKGTRLSGGQKQRIAIARALLRNPKILLLDEATSALDSESEKLVQEALDRAQQNRTSITIAHRLSTIQNADVICVLHNGTIVESGKHQDLLALGGHYHRLVHQNLRH